MTKAKEKSTEEEIKDSTTPVENDESMENILHSIRDIIAEDGETDGGEDIIDLAEIPEDDKEEANESTDVLEDIDAVIEDMSTQEDDVADTKTEKAKETPAPKKEAETPNNDKQEDAQKIPSAEPTEIDTNSIIAKSTATASASVMQDLVNNIPRPEIDRKDFRSGNTVEDLVLESVKPMLKTWLDSNLESIVREIVEREIRKLLPRE